MYRHIKQVHLVGLCCSIDLQNKYISCNAESTASSLQVEGSFAAFDQGAEQNPPAYILSCCLKMNSHKAPIQAQSILVYSNLLAGASHMRTAA